MARFLLEWEKHMFKAEKKLFTFYILHFCLEQRWMLKNSLMDYVDYRVGIA